VVPAVARPVVAGHPELAAVGPSGHKPFGSCLANGEAQPTTEGSRRARGFSAKPAPAVLQFDRHHPVPTSVIAAIPSPLGILPARTPLESRERELEFLKSQYELVTAGGGGRLIFVNGEPGVGKTRLARQLGLYARQRGGAFLEDHYLKESTPPYGPWIEALESAIRRLSKEDLSQAVGVYGAELSLILPGLTESALGGGPFTPARGSPEEQRTRLFDRELLRRREAEATNNERKFDESIDNQLFAGERALRRLDH